MIGSLQHAEDLITEEVLEKNKMLIHYAVDEKAPCEIVKRFYDKECHKNIDTLAKHALVRGYPFEIISLFLEDTVTEENFVKDGTLLRYALKEKAPCETIKRLYREELHKNDLGLVDLAIFNKYPAEIVSLFLGAARRVHPRNIYSASFSPYANEVVSFIAESGKCSPEALAIAMTLPAYTDETIEKIALNCGEMEFDEKFVLEAVRVRGIEMVKRLLNPRYLLRHRERELLKAGYSQEEIDTAFLKAVFVENKECLVCLVEFDEDECECGKVEYLQCGHKVHTECFKQVKDGSIMCFCGNKHRNTPKTQC